MNPWIHGFIILCIDCFIFSLDSRTWPQCGKWPIGDTRHCGYFGEPYICIYILDLITEHSSYTIDDDSFFFCSPNRQPSPVKLHLHFFRLADISPFNRAGIHSASRAVLWYFVTIVYSLDTIYVWAVYCDNISNAASNQVGKLLVWSLSGLSGFRPSTVFRDSVRPISVSTVAFLVVFLKDLSWYLTWYYSPYLGKLLHRLSSRHEL